MFNRENPQNSEPQNGPRSGLDYIALVNPISTRGDKLCTPNYYWHSRIFRPSDVPALYIEPCDTFYGPDGS